MLKLVHVTYLALLDDVSKFKTITPPKHISLHVEGTHGTVVGSFDSVRYPDGPNDRRSKPRKYPR